MTSSPPAKSCSPFPMSSIGEQQIRDLATAALRQPDRRMTASLSKEVGLTSFPPREPASGADPVLRLPYHGRVRVDHAGARLVRLYLSFKRPIGIQSPFAVADISQLSVALYRDVTGWFTAEVGRQPWAVYGVFRTADAMTPFLTTPEAAISLVIFCTVYTFIFSFGIFYIYRLIRTGLVRQLSSCRICGGAKPAAVACR